MKKPTNHKLNEKANESIAKEKQIMYNNLNFTLKMNKKSLYNTSISIYRDFRVFRFFL